MPNPVEPLVALQEVDTRLWQARQQLSEFEQAVTDTRAQVEAKRETTATERRELEDLERRRRDVEAHLHSEEERTKDHRMRMERIRNERELVATRREVDRSKEMIGLLEEEVLQLLEAIEGKSAEVKTSEEELSTLEERLAEREKALAEEQESLRQELADARSRRETLVADIDDGLLSQYELILQRRQGLAVVPVRDGSCTGCGLRVQPQAIMQIHRNAGVVTCTSCHRMLYVPTN